MKKYTLRGHVYHLHVCPNARFDPDFAVLPSSVFGNTCQPFRDRLGLLKLPQLSSSIWVHAVSVGEVKATEVLVEQLRRQFPGKPVVVSTSTPAGQQLARMRSDIVDHTFYFPIDLPFCVARALERVDPEMVIIAETEIWPNFLRACRERRIPVVMINGRISDRSYSRYLLSAGGFHACLRYTVMGMQSEMDRQRIQAIGADPGRSRCLGISNTIFLRQRNH